MKHIKADIWDWYEKGYHIIVPTNGWVNGSGENPMGRGIALQANKIFHKLDMALGNQLKKNGNHVFYFERQRLITFPTKNNWRDDSTLELIEQSCKELKFMWPVLEKKKLEVVKERRLADNNDAKIEDHEWQIKIAMPKVGCGWGKLTWDIVRPLVEKYFGEYDESKFVIIDNEQGDTKEYMKDNPANIRDKKEPFKIKYADTGEIINPV